MIPLIMAGAAAAAQIAKGIKKSSVAKRRKNMAEDLSNKGQNMVAQAEANRDEYQVSPFAQDSRDLALNFMNDNSLGQSMKATADQGASNFASQAKRAASTSGQMMAALLAGEQLRNQGYNAAATAEAGQDQAGMVAAIGANRDLTQEQTKAYEYNEMLPYTLAMERGLNFENQGIEGKIASENMRAEAFGDMMNGISSGAMAVGNAWGSGSGFDLKPAAGNWSSRRAVRAATRAAKV